ncbi:P-loop containing nucleoside triphosphate hydrolase protein [Testicularia cyperi]|uniref:P-loop containing nucleoside triphosphate hydrolase protein n=1 Tax=Testicularia cyperi TaxID=1882483 RepID=A0A317XVY7_9BASI|nr:P-loop containing nucleoside triphosphate hydrolase protein [Testicularia cyperi]
MDVCTDFFFSLSFTPTTATPSFPLSPDPRPSRRCTAMGRNRKEDRQARKRTKIGLAASQLHNRTTNSKAEAASISRQSNNAGFVFKKNQFSSLVNKGKARQIPHQHQCQQQQQANGQTARNGATASAGMDLDDDATADGDHDHDQLAALKAAQRRSEIAGAAESSNSATLDDDVHLGGGVTGDDDDAFTTSLMQLDPTLTGRRDSSIKAYMRELRKVVDNADVLLEVLDARDPLGCRSLETERMLLRAGKKVVLILNKIDLVPKSNVEAWLRYLRHDFPTLAFKASTQSQRNNLSQGASAFYSNSNSTSSSSTSGSGRAGESSIQAGSEAMGAGALLQLIKNYSRNLNLKTSIAVGVFGAPNVGKSSLINSLKRARVCSVASTPGHTKVVQSVMLDKSVRLLDCPGIVFSDESASASTAESLGLTPQEALIRRQSALLRNVVKVELVEDPITPVEAIMSRVEPQTLMDVYGLEFFQHGDAQDLLMRIAINRGRMQRGGKIDIESTARSVLHDWNVGRIKYYTQPPALHRSAILSSQTQTQPQSQYQSNSSQASAQQHQQQQERGDMDASTAANDRLQQSSAILSGFSEAFDLAGLLGEADAEIFGAGDGALAPGKVALPPAPRYAADEPANHPSLDLASEIQDDHEPVDPPVVVSTTDAPLLHQEQDQEKGEEEQAADTSRRSTLGKRGRGLDSDVSDSEDDDDDDNDEDGLGFGFGFGNGNGGRRAGPSLAARSNTNRFAVPGLHDDDDDDDDDEQQEAVPSSPQDSRIGGPTNPRLEASPFDPVTSTPRSQRETELAGVFSPAELSSMATPTSQARRKLKKLKKRNARAGAGLVELIQHGSAFTFHADAPANGNGKGQGQEREQEQGEKHKVGVFGNVAHLTRTTSDKGGSQHRKTTGSMFDVLMQNDEQDDQHDQDDDNDAQIDSSLAPTATTGSSMANNDDYEEEL